jgi:hypothetical protein
MPSNDKAQRATVQIGPLSVDGFQMPDGSYRMSQAGAAKAISESPVYALRFLTSKDSKALLGEAYTDYTPEPIEVEATQGDRGQTRINALPLEVVSAYWLYRAFKGNKAAFTLTWALIQETLERRFDKALKLGGAAAGRDSGGVRVGFWAGLILQFESALSSKNAVSRSSKSFHNSAIAQ